jgi:DNA-binding MurR/RpiR family transcriptional regulator
MNSCSRNLLDELSKAYDHLTKSQKLVAKYLVQHYDQVCLMSASEFADKVNVSEATITRFVGALGFNNFSEIKNCMRQSQLNYNTPYDRVVKSADFSRKDFEVHRDGRTDAAAYLNYDLEQLEKLRNSINLSRIDQAVNVLNQAKKIYLMGLGTCSALADFLHVHLRQLGFTVIPVSAGNMYSMDAFITANSGDVFLALTLPRYSKAILQSMIYAHTNGLKVVTITDSSASIFKEYCDVFLTIDIKGLFNPYCYFNSLILPITICQLLIVRLVNSKPEYYANQLKASTDNSKKIKNRL